MASLRQAPILMRIILVAIVSWIAGVTAYFGAWALVYGERMTWGGDTTAVLFWSAVMFGFTFVVLYLPLLLAMRRMLHGVRPSWPFPAVAVAIGVVPTALIAFFNGGDMRALLSPEAFLFGVMFGVIGLVVGVGFAAVYRDVPPG